jgi:plastocyanin
MTWLWRTCSSGLLAVPALAATLTGSVRLIESADPVVRKRADFSGVVVWLEPAGVNKAPLPSPNAPRAKMIQKDKRFTPHVLAIQTGAIVDFPNYDPIFHNAFSSFSGQVFDVGLYQPGSTRGVEFKRSGIVRVFCNIHPTMSAVIVVLDTPWFGVSSASGAFEIRDPPPGEYQLRVFHERATEKTLAALGRRITVNHANLALPPIAITETGYVETSHKNKYGKDYPPAAGDHGLYHGGHK